MHHAVLMYSSNCIKQNIAILSTFRKHPLLIISLTNQAANLQRTLKPLLDAAGWANITRTASVSMHRFCLSLFFILVQSFIQQEIALIPFLISDSRCKVTVNNLFPFKCKTDLAPPPPSEILSNFGFTNCKPDLTHSYQRWFSPIPYCHIVDFPVQTVSCINWENMLTSAKARTERRDVISSTDIRTF